MKNKRLIYILIPLVVIIWGLIIWKIMDFSDKSPVLPNHQLKVSQEDSLSISRYTLKLDYGDPFLMALSPKISKTSIKENKVKEVKISAVKPQITAPEIKYYGLVQCGKTHTGLVILNQKKYLTHQGENLENIYIKVFNKDSIWVRYQDKTYSYAKEN